LGDYTQNLIVALERIEEGERAFASDRERHDGAGEQNGVSDGENGELL
jgi:hypothetical protein